jgi:DNA repair protein RadC
VAELFAPFAGADAEPLAARLIGQFGSLKRVLDASLPQLRAAAGGHEAAVDAIFAARRLVEAALGEELVGAPVDGADPAVHQYLRSRIGGASEERLHAIFADSAGGYLADEPVVIGSATRIEARVRPLVERALALGAAGMLLAHNHPSGRCRPSDEDIDGTRRLAQIADALELTLIDHLIVTRTRVFSMRLGGCF